MRSPASTITSSPPLETERLVAWAAARPDVRAVALVGSYARGEARPDSDIDLVVLTTDVDRVVADEELPRALGAEPIAAHREWGVLIERRFVLPRGTEVDVGIVPPSWADTDPIDPGTARVVADGMVPIFDPDGLLAAIRG